MTRDRPAAPVTRGPGPPGEHRAVAPLLGAAIGVPVMAFGAWGAWQDPKAGAAEAARWLVGAAVVHDALWLPLVAVVTLLVTRRLPALARGPVAAAMATSALCVAVAWPYIGRYGANPTVPSLLVRDAATGTAAYVAAVWAVALAVVARRTRRARDAAGPTATTTPDGGPP